MAMLPLFYYYYYYYKLIFPIVTPMIMRKSFAAVLSTINMHQNSSFFNNEYCNHLAYQKRHHGQSRGFHLLSGIGLLGAAAAASREGGIVVPTQVDKNTR